MGAAICVGEANRKQREYQLPTIEFSAVLVNVFIPSIMADYACYIDYCHEVLGYERDERRWQMFRDLINSCGWIFYEKTVLVCDRI